MTGGRAGRRGRGHQRGRGGGELRASTGFDVLQTFVVNPVAMTLFIEATASLFAFDPVDEIIDAVRNSGAKTSRSGTW
ncbi:hypothetical protein [Couchioplanes azureus]|uniref:hypothetical protein n=1 Tax=Couchioplanes caeruleus TaxID=56438 RepID=UPI00166FB6AB|nr:hypothetical protein [Couchioplanes caeruleus]GGQ49371.1 hypothetical protein GCM10010166_17200 [Couchioplanes caeruleus subsp. azureus]